MNRSNNDHWVSDAQVPADSMAMAGPFITPPGPASTQLEDSLVEIGMFSARLTEIRRAAKARLDAAPAAEAQAPGATPTELHRELDRLDAAAATVELGHVAAGSTGAGFVHQPPMHTSMEVDNRGRVELSEDSLHAMWDRTVTTTGQVVVTFNARTTQLSNPVVRGSTMLLNDDNELAEVVLSMRLSRGKVKAPDVPARQVIRASRRWRSRSPGGTRRLSVAEIVQRAEEAETRELQCQEQIDAAMRQMHEEDFASHQDNVVQEISSSPEM